jgi:hypothetical protein
MTSVEPTLAVAKVTVQESHAILNKAESTTRNNCWGKKARVNRERFSRFPKIKNRKGLLKA